jgi:hypothetical protein
MQRGYVISHLTRSPGEIEKQAQHDVNFFIKLEL